MDFFMYRIDPDKNAVAKLKKRSFSELGFRERDHLQEWIAKEPAILGEELLIIQKEFDGFSDTRERLDLLAIDKQGTLVIIENKLDDTGKDVTWQALKYASYCSSLSKEHIRRIYQEYLDKSGLDEKAEDNISGFFEGEAFEDLSLNKGITQRIILLAANFRKEVTSTVLWLLNYDVRIQCFRVTPYSMQEELFLNAEQIIPPPDTEEYMIGMAEKAKEDITTEKRKSQREQLNFEFWTELLKVMNSKSSLFQNISPRHAYWIGTSAGISGIRYALVVTKTICRVEIYIDTSNKEENHFIFQELKKRRAEIDKSVHSKLIWDASETSSACRIKAEIKNNVMDKESWPEIIEFMTENMISLEKAFRDPLEEIKKQL